MRYGSVCSGIEAATVAWHPLGWTPAWFAEIDKFPSAVLAHHYPEVVNHGDFTQIAAEPGSIDLLVGGTPCQSFSVAGLRKGLDDDRGNLTLEFARLADRLRPRWIVWENVPGVLSIDGGRAFGSFLGALAELGYGFAYRVLDAQYFGVPQRRRRVFVVGCLGDWRAAAAVLFERHSLQGHPPPSREAGQGFTHSVAPSLTSSGRWVERGGDSRGQDPVVAMCLNAKGGMGRIDAESETFLPVTHSLRAEGFDASEDGTGRGTLRSHPFPGSISLGALTVAPILEAGAAEELMGTLKARREGGGFEGAVAFQSSQSGVREVETHATLDSNNGSRRHNGVLQGMAVRRLTPRECERLQGFPEIVNRMRIELCEDAKKDAALSVEERLALQNPDQNEPVAAHVLIDLERKHLQLHNHGKLILSVSIAEDAKAFPLSTQLGAFAQVVVSTLTTLEATTHNGVEVLQPNMSNFTHLLRGSGLVRLSGREIKEHAVGVEQWKTKAITYTTSQAGQDSQSYAQHLKTWSCCVASAIASFIPEKTLPGSSFVVEVHHGYTAIPYRGKPAADGPRYKALGNSMAVPCMYWIGERIAQVEHEATMNRWGIDIGDCDLRCEAVLRGECS